MARTKEYRRYKFSVKLEKRIKIYSDTNWRRKGQSHASYREKILKGELELWMRNTGVCCSCYMCSKYYKYNRPIKSDVNKIINGSLPINYKRKPD